MGYTAVCKGSRYSNILKLHPLWQGPEAPFSSETLTIPAYPQGTQSPFVSGNFPLTCPGSGGTIKPNDLGNYSIGESFANLGLVYD